jgi:hypothetical protein
MEKNKKIHETSSDFKFKVKIIIEEAQKIFKEIELLQKDYNNKNEMLQTLLYGYLMGSGLSKEGIQLNNDLNFEEIQENVDELNSKNTDIDSPDIFFNE